MAMAFFREVNPFFAEADGAPAMAFFAGACLFFDTDIAPSVVFFTAADPLFPVSTGAPEAPFFPVVAALVLVATEATNLFTPAVEEVATFSVGAGVPSEFEEESTRISCLDVAPAPVLTMAN